MSEAATKEIADWLGKLGMSEYAQRFAALISMSPFRRTQQIRPLRNLAFLLDIN